MATDIGERTYLSHTSHELDDGLDAIPLKALQADLSAEISARENLQDATVSLIDKGAKNLLQLTGDNVTGYGVSCVFDAEAGTITLNGVNPDKKCTGSFNVQVADPVNMALTAGKAYHFMCDGTSNDTYGIYIYKSGATPVTQWDCFTNTDADWNPAWSTSNGFRLFVRSGTVVDNVVLRPMICTAEDWAMTEQFVPFCPSLPALYRMILALGSGTQAQSLTARAQLMSGGTEGGETA